MNTCALNVNFHINLEFSLMPIRLKGSHSPTDGLAISEIQARVAVVNQLNRAPDDQDQN